MLHDQHQLSVQLSMLSRSTVTHTSSWSSSCVLARPGGSSALTAKLRVKLAPSCLNLTGGPPALSVPLVPRVHEVPRVGVNAEYGV